MNDWRLTLALANAFKEGDLSIGGTRDDTVRAEARRAILGTSLRTIHTNTLVDDGVSESLARSIDRNTAADLDVLTVGDVKAEVAERVRFWWVCLRSIARHPKAGDYRGRPAVSIASRACKSASGQTSSLAGGWFGWRMNSHTGLIHF